MIEVRGSSAAGELLNGAACTDPGRIRGNNEDLPLIDAARGIFGVIDGVGGEAGGEVAAATALDVILQRLARPLGTPAERVREAIAIANNEICRRAQASPELRGMACVITLALVNDGRLTIGHVGDTRLYKLRANGLRKLTRDHSPVGEREDAGELGEAEAMRHPRRNEVFRDVGSVFRDKDESGFVDVIEEPLERDSAILICSDGLTDMLPSPSIAHIVRQHAGDPVRVVEALVRAANDAGGKDNVTAVYAEGPLFASSLPGRDVGTQTPTEPLPRSAPAPSGAVAPVVPAAQPGTVRRAARAVVRSRTTWFMLGVLLGLAGALGLMFYVARTQVRSAQTRVVGRAATAQYWRIADAVAAAQRGDTILVEPGTYIEQVALADAVDVIARIPGTVTLMRPANLPPQIATLAAGASATVRIAGLRIEAPQAGPGAVAVRVSGAGAVLELLEILGGPGQVFDLAAGSSVTLRGSRVEVPDVMIVVPTDAQASFGNNVFVRTGPSVVPPISAGAGSRLALTGNVFSGFPPLVIDGLGDARRRELLSGNLVIAPPARPARRAAEPRR